MKETPAVATTAGVNSAPLRIRRIGFSENGRANAAPQHAKKDRYMSDEATWWTALTNLLSGSMVTLGGAAMGRLMWHGTEVKARRRKMFGKELIWEAPVIFGMWLIANGLQAKFGLATSEANALAVVLGYAGPRVIDMAIAKWSGK